MKGSDLKELRKGAKLSRPKLAAQIGVHSDTIKYWEQAGRVTERDRVPNLMLEALGLSWKEAEESLTWTRQTQVEVEKMRAGAGARHGVFFDYSEPGGTNAPRKPRIECGAKTRAGGFCKAKAVDGKKRCRMHGGLSTGPKTQAGRERISRAQKERWASVRIKERSNEAT